MKLLIVLSVIACGYAAKLDRTYLPPASAASAGGSPGSLNTPLGPSGFGQPAGFGQPGKTSPAFRGQQSGNNGFSAPSTQYGPPSSNQPEQAVGPNFDAGFSAPAQNFGNQAQDYQRSQPQRAQASADQNAEILRSDSQNDGDTFSYSFETSNGISADESGVATNGVQAQGQFAYSSDDGQSFRVQYTADENGYLPQGDHLPTSPPIPDEILKSIEKNAEAAAAGTQEGAYNPDEDKNDESYPQYNYNAPTAYNQAPTGQAASQGQGSPAQLYGAPNAGSRSQDAPQRSQGPSQYNAAGSGAARPSTYNQPQAQSPQYYGPAKPSNFGQQPPQQYSGPAAAARPNSFSQGSTQYSAPGSNNFASSGPKPQQYQSSSGPYPAAGRPQGGRTQGSVQPQDASGYNYNKPQGSPAQQYRPQSGAISSQVSRPNGGNAASGPSYQGSFGGNNAQTYGAAPSFSSQGSYTPASGPSGPKGSAFGSSAQSSFGPARPNAAIPSGNLPSSGANGFNRPKGAQGFQPQGTAKSSMPFAGYEYNKPGNRQFGSSPQNGNAPFGSSAQSGNSPFGGSQSGSQGRPDQFGAPRAPPSFSEEEGYKY